MSVPSTIHKKAMGPDGLIDLVESYRASGLDTYAARVAAVGLEDGLGAKAITKAWQDCYWAGAFSQWYMRKVYGVCNWHRSEGAAHPITLHEAHEVYSFDRYRRPIAISLMLQDELECAKEYELALEQCYRTLSLFSSLLPRSCIELIGSLAASDQADEKQAIADRLENHLKTQSIAKWRHADIEGLYDILCWNGAFVSAHNVRATYLKRLPDDGSPRGRTTGLRDLLQSFQCKTEGMVGKEFLDNNSAIYLLGPSIQSELITGTNEKVFRFNYQRKSGVKADYSLYNAHDVRWLLANEADDFTDLEVAFLRKPNAQLDNRKGRFVLIPNYDKLNLFKSNNAFQASLLFLLNATRAEIYVDGLDFFTASTLHPRNYRGTQNNDSVLSKLRVPLINHDLLGQFSLAKRLASVERVNLSESVTRVLELSEKEYARTLQFKSFYE